jgi:hypothetical protein
MADNAQQLADFVAESWETVYSLGVHGGVPQG